MTDHVTEDDHRWLRQSFDLARQARENGDRPFGALIVTADGRPLFEGMNNVYTAKDPTGHAELNILRGIGNHLTPEELVGATIYASGEPCTMCSAAIVWSGIGRVVYGLSIPRQQREFDNAPTRTRISVRCAEVVGASNKPIPVIGPVLEDEIVAVWKANPPPK
ncbi:MAG: nucleoside deaminase [Alphaproteobacteria bacterium]|nr:nucleoside deaminase [Alphaproteobacteria bacterium]MBU0797450.1 nucleoside deaminase [Alphaproteobacteria bacterium]MBU0888569.1 nucleoside deaminase [Alphaproteobacteria bacterium]MBU1813697.1 nucleoside deaminase [Alphaproteobacteria bacterium]MBU2091272.1 nucleoside deaminase [Alphaproteobacteria bacterium]